jgi:uncharacterized lipoprotein YajG
MRTLIIILAAVLGMAACSTTSSLQKLESSADQFGVSGDTIYYYKIGAVTSDDLRSIKKVQKHHTIFVCYSNE